MGLNEAPDESPVFIPRYEPRKAFVLALFMFIVASIVILNAVQVSANIPEPLLGKSPGIGKRHPGT